MHQNIILVKISGCNIVEINRVDLQIIMEYFGWLWGTQCVDVDIYKPILPQDSTVNQHTTYETHLAKCPQYNISIWICIKYMIYCLWMLSFI